MSGIPPTVRGIIKSSWILDPITLVDFSDQFVSCGQGAIITISVQIVDCFITGLDREHRYYTPGCESYDLLEEYS